MRGGKAPGVDRIAAEMPKYENIIEEEVYNRQQIFPNHIFYLSVLQLGVEYQAVQVILSSEFTALHQPQPLLFHCLMTNRYITTISLTCILICRMDY